MYTQKWKVGMGERSAFASQEPNPEPNSNANPNDFGEFNEAVSKNRELC
jgi:hypothetical protein